jgi:hypothetical protein
MDIGSPIREFVIEPIEEPVADASPSDPTAQEVPGDHRTGQD